MSRPAAFAAHAPLMGVPGAACPPGGEGDWATFEAPKRDNPASTANT